MAGCAAQAITTKISAIPPQQPFYISHVRLRQPEFIKLGAAIARYAPLADALYEETKSPGLMGALPLATNVWCAFNREDQKLGPRTTITINGTKWIFPTKPDYEQRENFIQTVNDCNVVLSFTIGRSQRSTPDLIRAHGDDASTWLAAQVIKKVELDVVDPINDIKIVPLTYGSGWRPARIGDLYSLLSGTGRQGDGSDCLEEYISTGAGPSVGVVYRDGAKDDFYWDVKLGWPSSHFGIPLEVTSEQLAPLLRLLQQFQGQ
ncbi:MAG: hypothetical protein PHS02_02310 [Candidatus ainarchaeum sp.]|nr:hypothetical protein [Candidatus ainarchaeum sp.]